MDEEEVRQSMRRPVVNDELREKLTYHLQLLASGCNEGIKELRRRYTSTQDDERHIAILALSSMAKELDVTVAEMLDFRELVTRVEEGGTLDRTEKRRLDKLNAKLKKGAITNENVSSD